jgi:hypothetical protein
MLLFGYDWGPLDPSTPFAWPLKGYRSQVGDEGSRLTDDGINRVLPVVYPGYTGLAVGVFPKASLCFFEAGERMNL